MTTLAIRLTATGRCEWRQLDAKRFHIFNMTAGRELLRCDKKAMVQELRQMAHFNLTADGRALLQADREAWLARKRAQEAHDKSPALPPISTSNVLQHGFPPVSWTRRENFALG
jgi:hypothetical protein